LEILCSVLLPGAKANAAHGLSIVEVLYYLWTYGKTQTGDQPIKASTEKCRYNPSPKWEMDP